MNGAIHQSGNFMAPKYYFLALFSFPSSQHSSPLFFKKHSRHELSPQENSNSQCSSLRLFVFIMNLLTTTPSPRFDLRDPTQAKEFDQYLSDFGYAVIAAVASFEQIESSKKLFWDHLETIPKETTLSRHDPSTWESTKEHPWFPSPTNGIISSIGQSDFCWSLRTLPGVRAAFQRIWRTEEELIVSFDGGCAFRPWKRNVEWLTDGGWWHMDQSGLRKGKQCVQGLVSLYDADETTGGLCVIPGSHHEFDAVAQRQSTPRGMDFVQIRKEDPILKNTGKLVCCKAGDMIVWDSRVVHCNTPASFDVVAAALKEEDERTENKNSTAGCAASSSSSSSCNDDAELIRLVAYVCMVPHSFASSKVIAARKRCYETNTQTSHWPHHNVRSVPLPDDSKINDFDSASSEVRRLIVGKNNDRPSPTMPCLVQ